MDLKELGFNSCFQEKFNKLANKTYQPARLSAVDKNSYMIMGEKGELTADISGRFRYDAETCLDYPTVGDWVCVQYFNNDTFAIIHKILPRKSTIKRKTSGKKIDYQLLSSNIDTAFIMQALNADFNLRRLERYLSMIYESNIKPLILLSKSDLIAPEELIEKLNQINHLKITCQVVSFSNKTKVGLEEIWSLIKPTKTYCLIGSSGVGKTTLLNHLVEEERYYTSEVRKLKGKGKHITTRRQLIILPNGGLIIDTPGIRELGNISIDSGITETFSDIFILAEKCKYRDCGHSNEPECAVREAIEKGELQPERLKSYEKLKKESKDNILSYLEKKEKERKFGRFYKKVMKYHKKKILSHPYRKKAKKEEES